MTDPISQGGGTAPMPPKPLPCYRNAGFVKMNRRWGLDQIGLDGFIDGGYLLGQFLIGGHNTPFAQPMLVQVAQNVSGPFQRNEVVLVEIHRWGFEPRPVLPWLAPLSRKFSLV